MLLFNVSWCCFGQRFSVSLGKDPWSRTLGVVLVNGLVDDSWFRTRGSLNQGSSVSLIKFSWCCLGQESLVVFVNDS